MLTEMMMTDESKSTRAKVRVKFKFKAKIATNGIPNVEEGK
jgi:hypothetical protein